jgi:Zn finger protein HypA/HybF involved in hydrogenase expression
MADAPRVTVYPPGCELNGCTHHYAKILPGCICPAWFDGGGHHTISVNPDCPAHDVPRQPRGPHPADAWSDEPVYRHRDCDAAIQADNLAGACPGCGGPAPGGEVRISIPSAGLVATYASQAERDRALRLAQARQQLACEDLAIAAPGGGRPWNALNDYNRETAALEARDWLRAAGHAGLIPSAADLILAVDALDGHAETKRDHADGCLDCQAHTIILTAAPACDTCKSRLATAAAYDEAAERLRAAQPVTAVTTGG